MDFDFSDDQQQLRDAVRKWVEKGYGFERRRGIESGKEGAPGFSRAAWAELTDLGLCGLYIPEDDGGLGMSPIEGMVVMEELGRGIVLEPLAQSLIAGAVISGYANSELQSAWLPKIAGGEAVIAVTLALVANLIFKIGLVISIGGSTLARHALPGLLAIGAGMGLGLLWL